MSVWTINEERTAPFARGRNRGPSQRQLLLSSSLFWSTVFVKVGGTQLLRKKKSAPPSRPWVAPAAGGQRRGAAKESRPVSRATRWQGRGTDTSPWYGMLCAKRPVLGLELSIWWTEMPWTKGSPSVGEGHSCSSILSQPKAGISRPVGSGFCSRIGKVGSSPDHGNSKAEQMERSGQSGGNIVRNLR